MFPSVSVLKTQHRTVNQACLLRPPMDVRQHSTYMKSLLLFLSLVFVASSHNLPAAELKTVDDFRAAAAKANAVLTIPDWEQTPKAVEAMMNDAIAKANKALDQIGSQDLKKATFKSTVVALDDLTY